MRKFRILSFLLAVLFCFASCDSGTDIMETAPTMKQAEDGIPTPGVGRGSTGTDARVCL